MIYAQYQNKDKLVVFRSAFQKFGAAVKCAVLLGSFEVDVKVVHMYNQSFRLFEAGILTKERNEGRNFLLSSTQKRVTLLPFVLLSIVFCHCLQIQRAV